jgi:hypothetical protein|tara:strand:- start:3230 stop:3478 length:249 start_codon:yes stop_codon:yes gene_type:complete
VDQETRARQANDLLQNTLLVEAFDTLRQELLQRWENSASDEAAARESIWLGLQLLERVRRHLESIVTTGEMAKLNQKNSPFI